jgi:hypothetical protein
VYRDEWGNTCKIKGPSSLPTLILHPDAVSNHEMGLIFEDLIRGFNEA